MFLVTLREPGESLDLQMPLLRNKRNILRPALELACGVLLTIAGIYFGVSFETGALHQPFIYGLFGLLCILLGMVLLADSILSLLERQSKD